MSAKVGISVDPRNIQSATRVDSTGTCSGPCVAMMYTVGSETVL